MATVKLPSDLRPRDVWYRKCELGIDLSASFICDLQGMDPNLYPVFHPYKMLWDSIINDYSGMIEDPRYQINVGYGHLNFGFVLTKGDGSPVADGHWHIWRLCRPYGWAHVINIDSTEQGYLNLLVRRLHLQTKLNDKYGFKGYNKYLAEMEAKDRSAKMDAQKALMDEIMDTNKAMVNRAFDNFKRGHTGATNPTKDVIMSGSWAGKRGKITRKITDKEGGLILPPGYGDE